MSINNTHPSLKYNIQTYIKLEIFQDMHVFRKRLMSYKRDFKLKEELCGWLIKIKEF